MNVKISVLFSVLMLACSSVQGQQSNIDEASVNAETAPDYSKETRPFDATRNAQLDVDGALLSARKTGKNVLLVLGANWCHDSRGVAGKLMEEKLSTLVDENYHLVYVDVGKRDRNLAIPKQHGIAGLKGTPTILILSPDGILLNENSVHDWRNAYSRSSDELEEYLQQFTSLVSRVTTD